MPTSFVKSAPELAEEILAKTAMLPKDLKSFPRELLEKEASTDTEKLELPKRLSVADLQKIASEKKVDLPTPGAVKADDYSLIAGDLQKIAKTHETETAQDILATATAIVAHKKEAGPKWEAVKGGFGAVGQGISSMFPGTQAYHIRRGAIETAQAARGPARAKIHGTPEYRARLEEKALKETKAERVARLGRETAGEATKREAIKTLGTAAIGVGVGVAGAQALKKPEKKERHITIAK